MGHSLSVVNEMSIIPLVTIGSIAVSMFSIGELSRLTNVKVPTIRYYEDAGLLHPNGRSAGNQRRYDQKGLERLSFIRHARELG